MVATLRFRLLPRVPPRPRFVCAEGVGGQRIACGFEGACPRAAAQRMVFAASAPSFKLRGVVQRAKGRGVAVNVDQAILTDIPDR